MSIKTFRVIKMPEGVFVGLLCQFSIMPLVGYGLSDFLTFRRKSRLRALVHSGGLASNVMAYTAKANIA